MTINVEGRKQARKTLNKFHLCLNSQYLLPSESYVPNRSVSMPILATNQIVALVISKNYEPIPSLISRAYRNFAQFEGKPVYDSYKRVAFDYLCQVAYFLINFTDIEKLVIQGIPSEISTAGQKDAPDLNANGGLKL